MIESFESSSHIVAAIGIAIPLVFTVFIIRTVFRPNDKGLARAINEFLAVLHKRFEQNHK